MSFILVESVVLCVLAAAVGLGIAILMQPLARKQVAIASVPTIVLVSGVAFAVLLAIVGGLAPAWRGMRLQVADALAGR